MADRGKAQYKAMRERWKIVAETHQTPLHRVLIVFMQSTATVGELKGKEVSRIESCMCDNCSVDRFGLWHSDREVTVHLRTTLRCR